MAVYVRRFVACAMLMQPALFSGCWSTNHAASSHHQLVAVAQDVCKEKFGWKDAYADPNLVFFDDQVFVEVFPSVAVSKASVEHPGSALVKLRIDGDLISVQLE